MSVRDQQTEAQLSMMAGAADRANRPRMLVIVSLLLVIASVVVVLALAVGFTGKRDLLRQRLTERAGVQTYIDRARALDSGESTDFAEIFPDFPGIGDEIERLADSVTGPQPRDKITVSAPQYKSITQLLGGGDPNLREVNVRCTFSNAKTGDLLEWMQAVEESPLLPGVFVTAITMEPREPGRWTGSVQFRRYVYRETAR
ncbi:MAG: hypothetical protein AAGH64_00745 [Planctomycetota bacterium]